MYIAVKSGTSINRWARAINVMLEKDPGNPCIHRLRIIHLFEADFNLYMKFQWGKRLVKRAVKHGLLNPGQFGSVPNHTAKEPILLTQLTNDNCRILKKDLARFDNDASACFDRIIVPLAMLAARRCGMSNESIKIHAETLQSMQYSVKTQFGVSEESYSGTTEEPLFGTGQGSGASPSAWLSLVVIIMNTMDRVVQNRASFQSPDSNEHHSRLIDAFVDDTSLSFTPETDISFEEVTRQLTKIATYWNRLLFYSGGSLNLQKCSYHVTKWEWNKQGRPVVRSQKPDDPIVCVTSMQTGEVEAISYQPYDKAARILGVYLSPEGDFSQQIMVMKKKADTYAARLNSPRLTAQDADTFMRTTYNPAMGYVLPSLAIDEESLNQVQLKILATLLQKLGFSSKTPVPLRHGPIDMGGLGLTDLRTEMGVAQLKLLRNAIFNKSEVGKMMIISIKYSQIEAGIKEHILERPDIHISYLTPTWITSVRQFLYQHNLVVTITNTINIRFQGTNDACIMNYTMLKLYSSHQQQDINLVRLYLQAITLSDISTRDGKSIQKTAMRGRRLPESCPRRNWPRQSEPTQSQVNIWQQYLRENFIRTDLTWNRRLGPVNSNNYSNYKDWRRSNESQKVEVPSNFDTFQQYLRSMPRWYRRLLNHYEQMANDVQIWKAFRRRDRFVEIASDGGLSNAVGTFGWKIVTTSPNKRELTLFQGSGFIDGPIEVGSSTRSELGGFTAPLLLATALARFWGIRHRCQFRWFTDSTSAISKVRMFSTNGKPRHFPENSDYVMVIQALLCELKRPIMPTWVKGHQDDDKPYNELPREARLNVDVDELATNHTTHHMKAKPMRRIDHIPCQLISLKINGQRFPSNWDANLRWTINGSYMKTYVKEKQGWDEETWNTIDFAFVKAYCKTTKSTAKHKWFKFMHNLQSTGERKQKMNRKGDDVNISQCPCCNRQMETQQHMVLCEVNPKRTEALLELSNGGSTYKEHHNFTRAMTDCIEQWIYDPTKNPSIDDSTNPAIQNQKESMLPLHMESMMLKAIHEQNKLGWMNLLRGYISNKWIINCIKPHE